MHIDLSQKLFVGIRVDNKLREALDHCPSRDRAYFDGTDARYLTMVRGAEDTFLGKVIDPGVRVLALDDLKRNILSLLIRIQARRSEEDVKVFALVDTEPAFLVPEKPGDDFIG